MTWIKLDDRAPRHPKVAGLSDRAFRLWIQAMCYASEFLTDGVLPVAFLRDAPAGPRRELLTAGLWLESGDGVTIHDYLEHQSSRDTIQRERARNRRRRTAHVPPVPPNNAAGSTTEKPRPENREQIAESRVQSPETAKNADARGASIVSPLEFEKRRRFNAYVGARLDVPHKLHADFTRALGGESPDAMLRAWYATVDEEIERTGEPIVPDVWKWLEKRFKPWASERATDVELAKFLEGA